MRRRLMAVLVVGVLVAAGCTRGQDETAGEREGTGVAGVQVERTAAPTEDPAGEPEPLEITPRPFAEDVEDTEDAEEVETVDAVITPAPDPAPAGGTGGSGDRTTTTAPAPTATPGPAPSPAPAPAPRPTPSPAPSPAPSPSPSPTPSPAPEDLAAGEGWSHTSARAEDGAWTESSAAPPRGPDGETDVRLFATLRGYVDEDTGDYLAECSAWLEASGRRGLHADGTVTVDLHVTGEGGTVDRARHRVVVELPAGGVSDDLRWPYEAVAVPAEEGRTVACTARYDPA
jgi:hypothetical protein